MSATEFKVGDRVRYSGGYDAFRQPEYIGKTGTVTGKADHPDVVKVGWDDGVSPPSIVYRKNVELAAPRPGDRVRAERSGITGTRDRGDWIEGALQQVSMHDSENERVVKTDKGLTYYVYADSVQPIAPEPQRGDRVRVSYEGVVTDWRDGVIVHLKLDNGETLSRALRLADVEVLERAPKPYPRGTVVKLKSANAFPLIRDRDGRYRNYAGNPVDGVTDERVRAGEFEVLHEPSQSA